MLIRVISLVMGFSLECHKKAYQIPVQIMYVKQAFYSNTMGWDGMQNVKCAINKSWYIKLT